MVRKSAAERQKWEKSRDIGQEILDGISEIKAGNHGRTFTAASFWIVRAREKSRLSQTLQPWP